MNEDFEIRVEHTIDLVSDLIPYNDPNYEREVKELAESIVLSEMSPDPSLNKIIEDHDNAVIKDDLGF